MCGIFTDLFLSENFTSNFLLSHIDSVGMFKENWNKKREMRKEHWTCGKMKITSPADHYTKLFCLRFVSVCVCVCVCLMSNTSVSYRKAKNEEQFFWSGVYLYGFHFTLFFMPCDFNFSIFTWISFIYFIQKDSVYQCVDVFVYVPFEENTFGSLERVKKNEKYLKHMSKKIRR